MKVKVACETWTGKTPFDPRGRFERRTFAFEAESIEHAKKLFDEAVAADLVEVRGFKFKEATEAQS